MQFQHVIDMQQKAAAESESGVVEFSLRDIIYAKAESALISLKRLTLAAVLIFGAL